MALKITEKVAFNIASEASYVYILSGQKFIKNAKNGQIWRVFENATFLVIFKHREFLWNPESWLITHLCCYLCYRSQILLSDRRMYRPRKPFFGGPERPQTGTQASKSRTLPVRGETVWPSMPLFIAIVQTLSSGKSLTDVKSERGLI